MPGWIQLFINLAIVALGVLISRRNRSLADSIACGLGVFCIAIGLVLTISGILHDSSLVGSLHRWAGHGLVIAIWLSGLFSVGIAAQQAKSRGVGILISRLLVIAFVIVIALVASFTGYLAPADDPHISIDTRKRFIVLHMFVVPTILAAIVLLWCRLFWPSDKASS